MINVGLCLLLFVPAAFANLGAERYYYTHLQPHIEPIRPTLSEAQTLRIQSLAAGDITGYFEIMFESWVELLPGNHRRELERLRSYIDFVPAERFPEYSLRAQLDAWNIVHILLPAHLERSILYYYMLFHELDHARQRLAILDETNFEYEDLTKHGKFWAKFEIERSAMTMEWFFLHHLPTWGRPMLAREIGSLLKQDEASALAQKAAMAAPLALESYLQVHWSAGRYSWPVLHAAACAKDL